MEQPVEPGSGPLMTERAFLIVVGSCVAAWFVYRDVGLAEALGTLVGVAVGLNSLIGRRR